MTFNVRRNNKEVSLIVRFNKELFSCDTLLHCLRTCEEVKHLLLFTKVFKISYFEVITVFLRDTSYFYILFLYIYL